MVSYSGSSRTRSSVVPRVSDAWPLCYCGSYVKCLTSSTTANPGRRFLRCPDFKCSFFEWVNPECSTIGREVIPVNECKTERACGADCAAGSMEASVNIRGHNQTKWIAFGLAFATFLVVLPLMFSTCSCKNVTSSRM